MAESGTMSQITNETLPKAGKRFDGVITNRTAENKQEQGRVRPRAIKRKP